jgi:hypothetical protein
MIFNDGPVTSFGARERDKKMLTFLELPCSNTTGTVLVSFTSCYLVSEMQIVCLPSSILYTENFSLNSYI